MNLVNDTHPRASSGLKKSLLTSEQAPRYPYRVKVIISILLLIIITPSSYASNDINIIHLHDNNLEDKAIIISYKNKQLLLASENNKIVSFFIPHQFPLNVNSDLTKRYLNYDLIFLSADKYEKPYYLIKISSEFRATLLSENIAEEYSKILRLETKIPTKN